MEYQLGWGAVGWGASIEQIVSVQMEFTLDTPEEHALDRWSKLWLYVLHSNGNASETKANESFDNGVFFG